MTCRVAIRPPERRPRTGSQAEHDRTSQNDRQPPPPRTACPGAPARRPGPCHPPRPGRALIHSRIVDLLVQEQGWNYRGRLSQPRFTGIARVLVASTRV